MKTKQKRKYVKLSALQYGETFKQKDPNNICGDDDVFILARANYDMQLSQKSVAIVSLNTGRIWTDSDSTLVYRVRGEFVYE